MIPVVWLVTVLAFFMSRSVPGDPVDALLQLRGVNPELSANDNSEYVAIYKKEGFDRPLFYFSVLPHYYPDNINSITGKYRQSAVRNLLEKKYNYIYIEKFLNSADEFLNATETKLKVLSPNELSTEIKDSVALLLSGLRFQLTPEAVFNVLNRLEKHNFHTSPSITNELVKACNYMQSGRVKFYYPVFRWHGFDNQYHRWFSRFLKFDFGTSIRDGLPVSEKIIPALKWTFILVILNLFISLMISVPLGIYSGRNAGGTLDKWSSFISIALYSMPVFWIASLMLTYFTTSEFGMKLFPITSLYDGGMKQGILSLLMHNAVFLILPVFCLVLNDIAYLSKLVRSSYIEEKSKLYVLFAVNKGLSPSQVDNNHIFSNIMIPLITVLSGAIPSALAGSLVIEVIFNIPGMGRLMHGSIFGNDWNVVFAVLIILSVITVLSLLAGDWLYGRFNPKIKADR